MRRASCLAFVLHLALTSSARAGDSDAAPPAIVVSAPPTSAPNLPSESGTTQRLIGVGLGEIGLAGLVAGTFFGLRASASSGAAHDECPSSANCPNHALAVADHDRAVSFAAASTVSLLFAAAGLTAGAFVFFGASSSEAPRAKTALSPVIGARSAGIVVDGAF